MFYIGRVIETKDFGKYGYIKVLLAQKYNPNGGEAELSRGLWRDLSNYSFLKEECIATKCMILTPMGSGYNTGCFQLPQINSVGLVAECLGNGPDPKFAGLERWGSVNFIWLGGLYGNKRHGEKVIIPHDDTVSDSLDYEDKTLITETPEDEKVDETELDDKRDTISVGTTYNDEETGDSLYKKSQLIIKTKSTYINGDIPRDEEVNFKNIPGENTVVLNKDKIAIRHNTPVNTTIKKAIADIIETDNQIKITRIVGKDSNGEETNRQTIVLGDENNESNNQNITISNVDNNGNYSIITLNENGSVDIKSNNIININSENDINTDSHGTSKKKMSDNLIETTTNGSGLIKINDSQITIGNNKYTLKTILNSFISALETNFQIELSTSGNTAKLKPEQLKNVKEQIENLFEE